MKNHYYERENFKFVPCNASQSLYAQTCLIKLNDTVLVEALLEEQITTAIPSKEKRNAIQQFIIEFVKQFDEDINTQKLIIDSFSRLEFIILNW